MASTLNNEYLSTDGGNDTASGLMRPVAFPLAPELAVPVHSSLYLVLKRCFDIALSGYALVILAPVFLLVALLISFSDGLPILYRQRRIGRHGTEFWIYKFRTMRKDADEILKSSPALREQFEKNFKLDRDPRIIGPGKWLRELSIDELPQLWNVLKGEMSIVGPRPVLRHELTTMYGVDAAFYEAVKPGCAGLWQCSGRNDTTYKERIELDKEYVRRASMRFDFEICCKTFVAVALRRGAK